jgi:hypothetical protein
MPKIMKTPQRDSRRFDLRSRARGVQHERERLPQNRYAGAALDRLGRETAAERTRAGRGAE